MAAEKPVSASARRASSTNAGPPAEASMADFEEAIREAAAKRADGVAIPDPSRWPDGWIHLSAALAKFTEAIVEDGGGFGPAYAFGLALESPELTDDPDFDDWRRKLAARVAAEFVDACRFEFVETGYRRVGGGGSIESMPSEWWDTEDIFLRFRTWSIDPAEPLSDRLDLPYWIWVDGKGLTRLCDKIWRHKHNIGRTLFVERGQLIGVRDALDVLMPFLPYLTGELRAPGGPDGAWELLHACSAGAVKAIASRMERRFDVTGRGLDGKLIEGENNWMVPADLWKSVDMSPVQNWAGGNFIARPNARNAIRLNRVLIDRADLLHYLEGMGLLLRVQYRHKGEEKPFAEGFAPAVPIAGVGAGEEEPAGADGDGIAPTDRTGGPGRPTAMHLVAMMMRQRFKLGEAMPTLSQEADELERLFAAREEYAALAKPKAKTIKNVLGSTYRQLKKEAESGSIDPEIK